MTAALLRPDPATGVAALGLGVLGRLRPVDPADASVGVGAGRCRSAR
ncbi:hypothetical protein [Kitasatospora kifunensis]|uniref:Uncharacterized protein n=1 Tax=Kitasatospora kifunensis TaxID=58351 RepID=A0A7W7VZ88_KITKI|nr:hypothetical protein [Kitasatospora kifunensis]MBB4928102.1 hypothetical protein [Kitasatospora kifunensis]MBB4928321.1 hypothetical protein [Kitasatospora kifunensis]